MKKNIRLKFNDRSLNSKALMKWLKEVEKVLNTHLSDKFLKPNEDMS